MRRLFTLLLFTALYLFSAETSAQQTEISGPPGSGRFGTSVTVLTTGNYVVTDPYYSEGGLSNIGAVYLYFGATNNIIGTIKGRSSNDRIGSGGVTALTNGHFVVSSPNWNDGIAINAGAVTWCNGFMGTNGIVSSTNSLVGVNFGDSVGSGGITALSNGNYVISSPEWNDGTTSKVGAVTWAAGTSPVIGFISGANSLIGTNENDQIGYGKVMALPNGNYLVRSHLYNDGPIAKVGAVTWGNGNTGITGMVSSSNSLVGSSPMDMIGSTGITILTNGNYVVSSPNWNGSGTDFGAVTWGNGATGISGVINGSNSLIGSSNNDRIGSMNITALTNGHYVVNSPYWSNGGIFSMGAVTWGNGNTGINGTVNSTNSLTGSKNNDQVGGFGSVALTNGNYVVCNLNWGNGTINYLGAITWCDGSGPTSAVVSEANSLTGQSAGDFVGSGRVIALTNGHYVVASPFWDNGPDINSGAVTWCNGNTGLSGPVTSANSLIGAPSDQVGSNLIALTNGNYVAISVNFKNGSAESAGAITWCDGSGPTTGMVSTANSIVGTQTNDRAGTSYFAALTNGNYVSGSSQWDNLSLSDAGAATWGNGNATSTGEISNSNSLLGSTANDKVGMDGIFPLSTGDYVVVSRNYDNGSIGDAGAITWGDGQNGTLGPIQTCNSVIGNVIGGGAGLNFEYSPLFHYLLVGKPYDNTIVIFDPTVGCAEPCTPPLAPVASGEEVCSGNSVQLQATGTGTLGWYDAATGGNWLGEGENFITGPLFATTTYYVQDSTCGPSETRTAVTVTVNPLPTAEIINLTGTNTLSCATTEIVLEATGGSLYSWNAGLGNNAVVNITVPGFYEVEVTDANGCSNSAGININLNLSSPATPHTVYGEKNVCPYIGTGTQLVYSVDEDPLAVSYTWTLPPSLTLVSGQGTNSITVTVNSNFHQVHKLLRVRANGGCGNSGEKLFYLVAQLPITPSPIIASDSDVCPYLDGSDVITYTIPKVAAASEYVWTSPSGTTIHHPNGTGANDTIIEVTFSGAMTSGMITVRAANNCGISNARSLPVIRKTPSVPGLITGPTNACEFMLPGGIEAFYYVPPVNFATHYEWTLPYGVQNVIGDGTTDISFFYPDDFTNGVVSVKAVNGCGSSSARNLNVTKLKVGTPSPIDVVMVSDCPDRVYTYTLSNMPSNSTFVNWTYPAGTTPLSLPGLPSLTLSYPNIAVDGFVTAQGTNNCSDGNIRTVKVRLPGCGEPEMKKTDIVEAQIDINVYPNPSAHQFNLVVNHIEKAQVRVMDITGRELMQFTTTKGAVTSFGKTLKAGHYLVEVWDGQSRVVKKIIKTY